MDNKSELFDLKREKRELDDFLSKLEEESSMQMEGAVYMEHPPSYPAENELVLEDAPREKSGLELEKREETITFEGKVLTMESKTGSERDIFSLELEKSALEVERTPESSIFKEQPVEEQPVSRFDDSFSAQETLLPESGKKPSFVSLETEEKAESFPPAREGREAKPQESVARMTQFEESPKPDAPASREAASPVEEKTAKKSAPEKKKRKSSAVDFSPEQERSGAGKWIGIGIGIIVIILIALLVWYFLFYSAKGGKTASTIKSSIPIIKTYQEDALSFVHGINLIQVRQTTALNKIAGKNIH
jgi:hypothetical protein